MKPPYQRLLVPAQDLWAQSLLLGLAGQLKLLCRQEELQAAAAAPQKPDAALAGQQARLHAVHAGLHGADKTLHACSRHRHVHP
jgi:hypothetical protein